MIDIGANIGATSIPRAVLGDFDVIYALEPELHNFRALCWNVFNNNLNGHVLPEQVAISSSDGTATLKLSENMTNHRLSTNPKYSQQARTTTDAQMVACRTLDSWCRERGVDPAWISFIKVDTQGWEGHILRGSSDILRHKHIVWQMEFSPKLLRKAGFSPDEMLSLLKTHFTHFFEMRGASDQDVAPIENVATILDRFQQDPGTFTDLVLFNLS